MLDVRLFANPCGSAPRARPSPWPSSACSASSSSITRYVQLIRSFDRLRAGIAALPFALVTGAVSPAAITLMKRVGAEVVVATGLALMSAGFLVAAGTTGRLRLLRPDQGRGPMSAGLALTSSPPRRPSWAHCRPTRPLAVNDTTRELGGTLGVAIVGSVMSSAYGSHVLSALTKDGAPAALTFAAQQSVVAGLRVASRLPGGLREGAADAVRQAFISGLHSGSLVAAGAPPRLPWSRWPSCRPGSVPPAPAAADGQPEKVLAPAGRKTAGREMVR